MNLSILRIRGRILQCVQFCEIEKIEHLYVFSKSGYKIGTYLETYIKIKTKQADNFRNDKMFRESVWDRLKIKETCPE